MPEHIFTLVARGHAVDAQSNTLTLFSVLEEIGTPLLPAAVPDFSVVTLWRRQAGEEGVSFVQRTRLVDPCEKEIFHMDSQFRMDKLRHRLLGIVQFVPFEQPGPHKVEILVRREDEQPFRTAATYPIEVNVVAQSGSPLFEQASH